MSKFKLFDLAPALEGLEEPNPAPAPAGDVTVPPGGDENPGAIDTPPADTPKDPNEENQDAPPGDAAPEGAGAADAALDSGQGSGDALGDGATGNGLDDPSDPDAVDPDAPIDFPDLDNLNVEQVAAVEAQEKELTEDQEVRSESVDDAVAQSKFLVAAVEGLQETIRLGKGITPLTSRSMIMNLYSIRERLGFQHPAEGLSMEGMGSAVAHDPVRTAQITMESFRNTLRTILQTIIKAIQQAIEWLVKKVKKGLYDARAVRERTRQLTKAILEQRAKDKDGALHAALIGNDEDNYVSLRLAAAGNALLILNKQPKKYAKALGDVLDEIEVVNKYNAFFGKGLQSAFSDLLDVLRTTGDEGFDDEKFNLAPIDDLFSSNCEPVSGPAELRGVQVPSKLNQSGYSCVAATGLLGDVAHYQFTQRRALGDTNLPAQLELLGSWTFVRTVQRAVSGSASGSLRYLSTQEIEEGSAVVEKIEDNLAKLGDVLNYMEDFEGFLKDRLVAAERLLGGMKEADAFFDAKDEQHGWKGPLLNALIGAMGSLVNNINESLDAYQKLGFGTAIAWNYYLEAIYMREKATMDEAAAAGGNAPVKEGPAPKV